MDALSIVCIALGLLVIASRAPLIFAPRQTLDFFDRLVATDARVRAIGLVMAPLALGLLVLERAEGSTSGVLFALGCLLVPGTLWLLAAPGSYRRFARAVLDFFENSVDTEILRLTGVLAVGFGVALIYVGLYVV